MSIAPALLCIALILGCSATDVEIENGNINQSSDAVELNDEEIKKNITQKLEMDPGSTFIGFDADEVLSSPTPLKKLGSVQELNDLIDTYDMTIISFYFPRSTACRTSNLAVETVAKYINTIGVGRINPYAYEEELKGHNVTTLPQINYYYKGKLVYTQREGITEKSVLRLTMKILAEIPWTTNSLDWIEANRKMNGMIVGVFPNHNVKRYRLYLDFYAKHKLEYEESFILLNVTNDSFQTFLDFYNLTAPAGLQSDSKNHDAIPSTLYYLPSASHEGKQNKNIGVLLSRKLIKPANLEEGTSTEKQLHLKPLLWTEEKLKVFIDRSRLPLFARLCYGNDGVEYAKAKLPIAILAGTEKTFISNYLQYENIAAQLKDRIRITYIDIGANATHARLHGVHTYPGGVVVSWEGGGVHPFPALPLTPHTVDRWLKTYLNAKVKITFPRSAPTPSGEGSEKTLTYNMFKDALEEHEIVVVYFHRGLNPEYQQIIEELAKRFRKFPVGFYYYDLIYNDNPVDKLKEVMIFKKGKSVDYDKEFSSKALISELEDLLQSDDS